MQQNTECYPPRDNEEYLEAVESLTAELERAMTAMVTGAVADFEGSLLRQHNLTMRLVGLRSPQLREAGDGGRVAAISHAPLLTERIKAAVSNLLTVTRQYSMLLKHFGQTARLFAGMFRSYGGASGIDLHRRRSRDTWSCEL